MAGVARVVVHLGPMKTGTSAFAAHLSMAALDGSLPPDIIYPVNELWFPATSNIVKHHDLVEIAPFVQPDGRVHTRNTTITPEMVESKLREVAAEARRRGGATAVLVCELADQLADPEQLGTKLRAIFDRVDFVIVARQQAKALPSLLGQQARMWKRKQVRTLRIAPFLRYHLANFSYDYEYLWAKWSRANAPYAMHFVPYSSGASGDNALSQRIFDRLGLGTYPLHAELLTASRIHTSFSRLGMHMLIGAKRLERAIGWLPGGSAIAQRVFERFLGFCHAQPRRMGERFRPWRLTPSESAKVVAGYRASNIAFRVALGSAATTPEWEAWFAEVGVA
jgi:hypothetical protein